MQKTRTRIQMKLHLIGMTNDITSGPRIMISLPNSTIIIILINHHEILITQDFMFDNMSCHGNTAHSRPDNNTEFMFRIHLFHVREVLLGWNRTQDIDLLWRRRGQGTYNRGREIGPREVAE